MTTSSLPTSDDRRAASADAPDEARWADDGGNLPSTAKPRSRRPGTVARQHALKLPQDTAQGCRDRATADLLEAVTMATANGRLRMESSAASWTVRAQLLDRIEDSFARRVRQAESAARQQPDNVRL